MPEHLSEYEYIIRNDTNSKCSTENITKYFSVAEKACMVFSGGLQWRFDCRSLHFQSIEFTLSE